MADRDLGALAESDSWAANMHELRQPCQPPFLPAPVMEAA